MHSEKGIDRGSLRAFVADLGIVLPGGARCSPLNPRNVQEIGIFLNELEGEAKRLGVQRGNRKFRHRERAPPKRALGLLIVSLFFVGLTPRFEENLFEQFMAGKASIQYL